MRRRWSKGDQRILSVLDELDCVIAEESGVESMPTSRGFEGLNVRAGVQVAAARLDTDSQFRAQSPDDSSCLPGRQKFR